MEYNVDDIFLHIHDHDHHHHRTTNKNKNKRRIRRIQREIRDCMQDIKTDGGTIILDRIIIWDEVWEWLFKPSIHPRRKRHGHCQKGMNCAYGGTSALAATLERYSNFDPMDMLVGTFWRIPVEDNLLDPHFMDAAMNYTQNRWRFLTINHHQEGRDNDEGIDMEMLARQRPRTLLGTWCDGMELIDPDLPLVEFVWKRE